MKELQPGIKSGDQDSLYVYSLMLKDGLGVEPDSKKARDIMKRVALTRDNATMQAIGSSALLGKGDERDLELAKAISKRMIEMGYSDSYYLGSRACAKEFETDQFDLKRMVELAKTGDHLILRPLLEKQVALKEKGDHCRMQFLRLAAEKGNADAVAALAELTADASQSAVPNLSFSAADFRLADPDVQRRTGYINGTKQIADGGVSTFKIDNTQGGSDAIVRLYRDGEKSAARSMFIKNGESFTAGALAPSTYKLRYRYIGSDNTFEASDKFTLTESPTASGTRFSRVIVTLYKVADGNMTVKKVDASEF